MELKKTYCINIITQKNENYGLFIAVEKFSSDSSQYFQSYYKQLLKFNQCGNWFETLEQPQNDLGRVVLVKIKKENNLWARGIISKFETTGFSPKIYLIDSQTFFDYSEKVEMRVCPRKFLQLLLPTYNIDVNICLDNENIKTALEILVNKNQLGEISFCFIPQFFENNVYYGELIINNKTDNSFVPLKMFLKHIYTKKYFNDKIKFRQRKYPTFNPFKFNYLLNIFIPKDPHDMANLEESLVSSYLDISNLDNSLENLSIDESCERSSTLDSSGGFSDDSVLSSTKKILNNVCIPIAEQKVHSLSSSSISTSNSSLNSVLFVENKIHSPINSEFNGLTKCINEQNTKLHCRDEDEELCNLGISNNTSNEMIVFSSSCSSNTVATSNKNDTLLSEEKPNHVVNNKTTISVPKENTFMKALMKKRISLSKTIQPEVSKCQMNNSLNTKRKHTNPKQSDSDIWWSSDDES